MTDEVAREISKLLHHIVNLTSSTVKTLEELKTVRMELLELVSSLNKEENATDIS